jgi:hypothetical protein
LKIFLNIIVSQKDVESELIKTREEINKHNQSICYYHGNIDRNQAEKLLKEYYYSFGILDSSLYITLNKRLIFFKYYIESNQFNSNNVNNPFDGLFLIRKCSASPEDFSLSMIFKGNFYHYRISHSIDAYYVLGINITYPNL